MKEVLFVILLGAALGVLRYLLERRAENEAQGRNTFFMVYDALKPALRIAGCFVMCSVLLGNSDEKVSDAVNYVKPSKYIDLLMGKLYE